MSGPPGRQGIALAVFAKAPVAGQAKTRLIPALGAEGAADLAATLLEHTMAEAAAAGFDHVELCTTPEVPEAAMHPALRAAASHHGCRLTTQGDGDLGDRMHRASSRLLATHRAAIVIGTDAPALDAARLREAAAVLVAASTTMLDAVFVPALDGGYALVGLSRPAPMLFATMPWSTSAVMATTRERARAAGLRWLELAPVADIDEPADLRHLPAGWPLDRAAARASQAPSGSGGGDGAGAGVPGAAAGRTGGGR